MTKQIATSESFIELLIAEAVKRGYVLERTRNGRQIDFGNKKLHEGHFRSLFPSILSPNANVRELIENVAPGRPCTHRPMREIICTLTSRVPD